MNPFFRSLNNSSDKNVRMIMDMIRVLTDNRVVIFSNGYSYLFMSWEITP